VGGPQDQAVPVEKVEFASTVEIDRRRLEVLEGARKELYATQRVLAVVTERLLEAKGGDVIVVEAKAFENAPDLRAGRDPVSGEVTVAVFR
jgi:hypothetical protein